MVKEKIYKNGLKLIVNSTDYVRSVAMGILVGAGSHNETSEENGISHFIEHVNFKGTAKRTSFEISDGMDSLGAQMNAFTAKEVTCYYVKCIREHTEECFEMLSDLFLNSQYPEDELDKERGVILEEIKMNEDIPEDLCMDLLAESYFGKSGYGRTILGTPENVKSFGKKDILEYRSKYYVPSNTAISFVGNVSFEQADYLVSKYFESFEGGTAPKTEGCNYGCLGGNFFADKKINQAHIALGMPAPSLADAGKYPVMSVNAILGGGTSSRLFQNVREKQGLAYTVYSYSSSYLQTGVMVAYAGVSSDNTLKAYESIINEIKTIGRKGVGEKELNRTKEQIKCSTVFSQESVTSLMMAYGKRFLLLNEVFDIERELAKIDALNLDVVNGYAQKWFTLDNFATAIVGSGVKPLR